MADKPVKELSLREADQLRAKARFDAARAALPPDEPFLDFTGTVGQFGNDDVSWFLVRVPYNFKAITGKPGNVRVLCALMAPTSSAIFSLPTPSTTVQQTSATSFG